MNKRSESEENKRTTTRNIMCEIYKLDSVISRRDRSMFYNKYFILLRLLNFILGRENI